MTMQRTHIFLSEARRLKLMEEKSNGVTRESILPKDKKPSEQIFEEVLKLTLEQLSKPGIKP